MQLETLFTMQRQLDTYIQNNHNVHEDLFKKKGLALLVELAELANETRCFKFWSTKAPSKNTVILEEYVDSIHFLLSLGIEKGFDSLNVWPSGEAEGDLTDLFLLTQQSIQEFMRTLSFDTYQNIWIHYGAIANKLGFSNEDIMNAYIAKNEENYNRQNKGY